MRIYTTPAISALAIILAACSSPGAPSPSSSASAPAQAASESTSTQAADASSTTDPDGVLTLALGRDHADTFNPLNGWAPHGYGKIYDGLYIHDQEQKLQPALASALPEVSADGLTVSVPIREGVTFHDGSTFGPEDVVETFNAILDPKSASPAAAETFAMLKEVKAEGTKVIFTLDRPYVPFVHGLTIGIVPSEMAKPGTPVTELELNTKPVGTGPYKVESIRDKLDATLVANENYWGTKPSIKKVQLIMVEDPANIVQRIEIGEIDGAELEPRLAEEVIKKHGDHFDLIAMDSVDFRGVVLPMKDPVAGDATIRQAMGLAVNRDAMIDKLFLGHGSKTAGPIPQRWTPWANPDIKAEFDVEKANTLLDEAGWVKGSDGVRMKDGQRATFNLLVGNNLKTYSDLALAFSQDMKAIGLDVKVEALGWDVIAERFDKEAVVYAGGDPSDPDLQLGWLLDSAVAGNGFQNPGFYKNAKIDALLKTGRESQDESTRIKAYQDIQSELAKDPNGIYFMFARHTFVQRKGYTGFKDMLIPHVHGVTAGPWWNLEEWAAS